MMRYPPLTSALCSVLALAIASQARAQSAIAPALKSAGQNTGAAQAELGIQEIVVTAQKRSENINRVGLSISAATADRLIDLGITDARDLGKLVPGFTFSQTTTSTPVYTIRGIGYNESSLGATPAVTVYVDQAPLSYPALTRNAAFDLERVEVLKGPQGTIFGQNSTGGAVNYIAAKPTKSLHAGFDISGGRFNLADATAFISGPISNSISARLSVRHEYQGDWQYSSTRPGDTRGQIDLTQARLLLDVNPSNRLRLEFGASGWLDDSDTQAAQLLAKTPSSPQAPAFIAYPLIKPTNARVADWSPNFPEARHDRFYLLTLRADYELSDLIKLTSLTGYSHLRQYAPIDADGTSLVVDDLTVRGKLRSFNQELRLRGDLPHTRWVVGGNYSTDRISESQHIGVTDGAGSFAFDPPPPAPQITEVDARSSQSVETGAVFANVEQDFSKFTIIGGVRYTKSSRHNIGCVADGGDGAFGTAVAGFYNFGRSLFGLSPISIPPGGCVTADATFTPTAATGNLKEHNVSWRLGLNYRLNPSSLLYGSVSKGYKAGTFADIGGLALGQFEPTKQESVTAYEAGFKLGLLNRRLQLNGAGFYYNYDNKQIRGKYIDRFFGPLESLVNIPKSRVWGAEMQVTAAPVRGLDINVGATYLNTKVTSSFVNFSTYGTPANFQGDRFPFTPKLSVNADAQYSFPVLQNFNAFFGGNVTYTSRQTTFYASDLPYIPPAGVSPITSPQVGGLLEIRPYALLDLRVGIEAADKRWKFMIWGHNVTNTYYWNNVAFFPLDATVRYAGLPVTYGATLRFRY